MADVPKSRTALLQELAALRARLAEAPHAWQAAVVEAAPQPFLVTDRVGVVVHHNAACRALFGDALQGEQLSALLHADGPTPLAQHLATVAAGGEVPALACTTSSAPPQPLTVRLTPRYDAHGAVTGCLVLGLKLPADARREAALVAAREAAEASAQRQRTLMGHVSHEIRTPLTAILGFTELLVEEVPGPQQEFALLLRRSGERLMSTLLSVLELARLEADETPRVYTWVDLYEEARDVAALFRTQAREKGLALQVKRLAQADRVWADQVVLTRVLTNLVSNAVKFTTAGRVTVAVGTTGQEAVLRVADTGPGIRPDFLPHLFEEFRQEAVGHVRGAGLGLAITHRLVAQLGGTIDVDTAVGEGTTFTVRFPRFQQLRSGTDEAS